MRTCIVLLDCSVSVVASKYPPTGQLVCEQLTEQILNQIQPTDTVYIIGWNSDRYNRSPFKHGIHVHPEPLKKTDVLGYCLFLSYAVKNGACTEPRLGFENIPPSWFEKSADTVVILGTDGQIGWNQITDEEKKTQIRLLCASVDAMPGSVNVEIICVDAKHRDYTQLEDCDTSAGFDVFRGIRANAQTFSRITLLRSVSPGHERGFTHLDRKRCPPGHLQFRGVIFRDSELFDKRRTIIKAAVEEAKNVKDLLSVVHEIYELLGALPPHKFNPQMFFIMFQDTPVFHIARQIFSGVMPNTGLVKAEFIRMNQKYKDVTFGLKQCVREMLPFSERVYSFVDGKQIWDAPRSRMSNTWHGFKNAAVLHEGTYYPTFACPDSSPVALAAQALRQWLRQILSDSIRISIRSNALIFEMFAQTALVATSPGKLHFQNASIVMLKKKGLTRDTLYQDLCAGETPPQSEFHRSMDRIGKKLGLKTDNVWQVWWFLLECVGDADLLKGQKIHCLPVKSTKIVLSVNFKTLPRIWDYHCPVTLEDTSETGGFAILAHGIKNCSPNMIFMEAFPNIGCVFCLTQEIKWEKVPPKPKEVKKETKKVNFLPPIAVIILEGTVGSGKSSVARATQNILIKAGWNCTIASADYYAVGGLNPKEISERIRADIQTQASGGVVIIDTCSYHDPSTIFGYQMPPNFVKFRIRPNYDAKNWQSYLAWATLNVLQRKDPPEKDTYYLSPNTSSMETCLSVAKIKARSIVGKRKANRFFQQVHHASDPVKKLTTLQGDWVPTLTILQTAEDIYTELNKRIE